MSDAELERAATAPSRWIALSSSRNDDKVLSPRVTQVIVNDLQPFEDMGYWGPIYLIKLYLVPGGR